jgi:hypothetical protein
MLKMKGVFYMISKTHYILYLIILIVGFGGCLPTTSMTNQTVSTSSDSPTPEDSRPVILTATLLPGLSPTPSPEYPQLVTPRVTPLPTRSPADIQEELRDLLRTNGNCVLPCFWGIQPDQTRYDKLYGVIDKLGGLRFDALQENGRLRVASNFRFEERNGIFVEFAADLQDDVVRDLKVLLLNLLDTGITREDWSAYTMDEILGTYGVPDMVELYFSGPNNALSFGVRLKYEQIDTTVTYYGATTENDKYQTPSSVIFCQEEIGIDMVELHMGNHPFNDIPEGVPLSKATGLDEQAFHKLFTENPSACLTLNREAMQ